MKTPLTEKQRAVLDYLISSAPSVPTRDEIREYFGWTSRNAAEGHLKALERKGYIRISPLKARQIKILKTEG